MKTKTLYLIIALIIAISMVGCQNTETSTTDSKDVSNTAGEATAQTNETEESSESASTEDLPRQAGYDVVAELQAYDDVMELTCLCDLGPGSMNPEDKTVQYIAEYLKLDISQVAVDNTGDYSTLVMAKLAANDLPDFIQGFSLSLFKEIAPSGQFLDMSELLANYAPDTVDFIGEDVLDKYREADGALYLFPGNTIPTDDLSPYVYPQHGPMLNMALLEQTGLDVPTTTEELYNVLKAFAGLDTDTQNIIPFGMRVSYGTSSSYPIGSSTWLKMFYPGTGYYNLVKNDETKMIDLQYDHPAYLEYLKYFGKLYREHLLDQDAFTITEDAYNERLKAGDYGMVWADASVIAPTNTALSGNVMDPYQPIDMIQDYEGDTNTYSFKVLGDWLYLFNTSVDDPERLAKYIDWQYTMDGVRVVNYGAPDPTLEMNCWYYDDAGEIIFDQDLQREWDEEDYTWNWMVAGGWGVHSCGLRACIKYTAVNEMGLCLADELYLAIDDLLGDDMTVNPSFEAMGLQPKGTVWEEKGATICDSLHKWEVKILINAADDAEVETMFAQMMAEARELGYDEMKMELYDLYLAANPE